LLIRAVQESAALTALGHSEILQALNGQKATDIVFCGGASKGRLWPQIVADVFDLPVRVPKVKETTSLGAAFCALVGIGEHASLAEAARELVQLDRVVDPEPRSVAAYREIRRQAFDLQRGLMEWVDTGRLKAMWRGAGAVTAGSAPS
jgi:autoinducer 2 (AI-2) kinase